MTARPSSRPADGGTPPSLSVILTSGRGLDGVRATLGYLRRQTAADRLELVLVLPVGTEHDPADPALRGFRHVRTVPVARIDITGDALAAGVRDATAPLVAYAEEHAFPEPGWAEALIAAHRGPWAAVGACLDNANPATATSWAHLYTDFGPAVWPLESGERTWLPWHGTSYKRDLLLACGERLAGMLEVEGLLHRDLIEKGHRLYLESGARLRHTNPSTLAGHVRSEFLGGRLYGASRARESGWSAAQRVARAVAWPLTPAIRLYRTLPHVRRRTTLGERLLPRILPSLLLGLTMHALGEAVGYLCGVGDAMRQRADIELDRDRYITEADRERLAQEHAAARTTEADATGTRGSR